VLDGHVQVAQDARLARHHVEQSRRDPRRVEVEHADPRQIRLGDERLEQLRQAHGVRRAVGGAQIAAVVRQVLRHQVHLARALQLQELRLAHHVATEKSGAGRA
jgi:hypothetical protein